MNNKSYLYTKVAGKYSESECLSIINAIDIPNLDFKKKGESLLNLEEFHTLFVDRRNKFDAVFFFAEKGVYYICHREEELDEIESNLKGFEGFIDTEIISARAVKVTFGTRGNDIVSIFYTLETEKGEMKITWTGDKDARYSNDTHFYFTPYDQLERKDKPKNLEDIEKITRKVFRKYHFSGLSPEEFRKALVNELSR